MRVQGTSTNSSAAGSGEVGSSKKTESAAAAKYSKAGSAPSTPGVGDATKTSISTTAKDMAKAKDIAMKTPDVREDKIAALKKKIEDKEYHVSPEAIADRMVNEHVGLS